MFLHLAFTYTIGEAEKKVGCFRKNIKKIFIS